MGGDPRCPGIWQNHLSFAPFPGISNAGLLAGWIEWAKPLKITKIKERSGYGNTTNMVKADSPVPQMYRQEEAQAILQLAFARQEEDGELSRSQLWEIATELGISPEDLQAAEGEWLARQGESREKKAFNVYRQNRFKHRLIKYVIVNGFLILLNLVTMGGLSWSIYVLLGWGLGLSLDAWKTYQTSGEDYDRAFSRWRLKQQVGRSLGNFAQKLLNG